MGKKFSDLVAATMSPESIAASKKRAREMANDMAHEDLLCALGQTKKSLARELDSAAVAELERCAGLYLSRLRAHIEEMGGTLEIVARFGDSEASVKNLALFDQASPEVDPAELKAPAK
jgi:hypothetical protein